MVYELLYFATAYRIVVLRLFKLNIKARYRIPEFLNENLWSIHFVAFNIDWSWNMFTLHNFCSMLIEHLVDLEKVRTENLKFRIDFQDQVMDGWSIAQNLQSIKTFWLVNWVSNTQYHKSGSLFCRCWQRLPPTRKGPVFVISRPTSPLILPSKPSRTFWNSLLGDCQMNCRSSNSQVGLKLDLCRLTNELLRF